MIREITYMLIPLIGMLGAVIVRRIIDGKLRKILYSQGKNPNPPELELIKGIFYPGQYKKRLRQDVDFRKSIDEPLGKLYQSTYAFHVIMCVCIVAVVIFIE